ncbi:hypothetical protein [Amycolatopsis minnesotensis]|uniref:Uncharacterized protein n=1 Tax=Amycolatopsis minnesotensis TaxID=337894 RepID=A0ABN2S3U8_9PSEU
MSTIRRAIGVTIASVPVVLFAAGTASASSGPDTAFTDSGSVAGAGGAGSYHTSSGTRDGATWSEDKFTFAGLGGAHVHHRGAGESREHDTVHGSRAHYDQSRESGSHPTSSWYHDDSTAAAQHENGSAVTLPATLPPH